MNQNRIIKNAVSMILIMTIVTSFMMALPINNAQTINYYHTYLYVGTSAGGGGVAAIGKGQSMLITAWTKDMPPDIGETIHNVESPTGRAGWWGVQLNITKPDGTSEIKDMGYSDPVGNNYMTYVPDQVGVYTIYAIFPATWKNSTISPYTRSFYSAAVSPTDTFTVVEEPVPLWSESPLPQDYWTRPISGASRDWYVLTGNKLGGASGVWPMGSSGGNVGNYFYGKAPESAHILWSKPYAVGGLMDERTGTTTFETTHYQGVSFTASLILDGKIYCTPRMTTHQSQGLQIIDLYTGETLYQNYTDSVPSMASIYNYNSPNQMGGFAYLWKTSGVTLPEVIRVANATQDANCKMIRLGNDYAINTSQTSVSTGTMWQMLDGWTRTPICIIANVSSSGTQVYGKDGSILYYNIVNKGTSANPSYYCTIWNSSAGTMVASVDGTGYWQWRPAGGQFGASNNYFATSSAISNIVHNGAVFYSQNFSIPSIVGPDPRVENATIRCIRQDEFMIVGCQGWNNGTVSKGWMMAIGLNATNRGQKLWEMTYNPPFADPALNVSRPAAFTGGLSLAGVYPEEGVLAWSDPQTCKRWVYDLYTGQLLWESPPEAQYEYYGISTFVYQHQLIGYGSYAGQFISYDIKTGKQLWNYTAKNIGFESPYGNYPMSIAAVADGKIYTITSEHHNIQPMYRGPNLRCINATTGEEIWKILCFGSGVSIADGILIKGNCLDNMIYAFGKGPSATTVAVSPDASILGNKVMIKGTVTDQTNTGRHNTNDGIDFTLKDTPAISDEDMSAWMEYKYMQQARPANAKGVDVRIDVLDPNGNFYNVGTTTSDINGNFALPYDPEVPGTYKVMATFDGSKSYGPSYATAYLVVSEEAVAPTVAPTAVAQSAADIYFVPAIVGLFVLIIVVAALLALMIRKRP
ncbi:MAG: PQQ-binding-like beta-propeller repeat protein [Candidatus Bathyarchaeota archaeon]|nr:PQQ-binding-like beta-propeller repeat protein [Candidatus Bathyarchaeota archaeon]